MKDIPTNTRYKISVQTFPKMSPKNLWPVFTCFFVKVLQSLGVNQKEKMGPKNIGETKFHVKLLQSLGANQRNYAEVQITIEPEFSVIAQLKVLQRSQSLWVSLTTRRWECQLVTNLILRLTFICGLRQCFQQQISFNWANFDQAVSSNMYKITDWMSEEDEEDEE